MPEERSGAVTLNGNTMTLVGAELKVGDSAPAFTGIGADFSEVTLDLGAGKTRLFLSVTSLDTPVCDAETKKFSTLAADFPANVDVYIFSVDLPAAQKRWCGASRVANIKTVSDHRAVSFGDAYGTHVKELRLLSRAVFVIDPDDVVQYVEYVLEIGEQPDYDAAAAAVKKVAS